MVLATWAMPEEWGGTTLYCQISALKKIGIDELLDTILLQSEMLELKANADVHAEGKVLESRIDQGRGIVASVLVERGTLRQGDYYVAGIYPGRVRAMFDDKGRKIEEAGPSTPVEIIGLSDIPGAGDPFQVTEDERQARQVGAKRQELERLGESHNVKKVTLDTLYSKIQEGTIQEFNVIIKGDVQGSVEGQGVGEAQQRRDSPQCHPCQCRCHHRERHHARQCQRCAGHRLQCASDSPCPGVGRPREDRDPQVQHHLRCGR